MKNITLAPVRAAPASGASVWTTKSSPRSRRETKTPSAIRSSTTVVIAALRRIELRWAIRNGRANSPSRKGSTRSIMKPMALASFSERKRTRSCEASNAPQRAVRVRWTSNRMPR